jgi:TonB-linked SusC/RagA family outer membrane protein
METQGKVRIPEKLVTLSAKGSPLSAILKKISKNTGITIYFNNLQVAPFTNVTLTVKNKPFTEVMQQLLYPRGLDWVEVNENTITVRKAPVAPQPSNIVLPDTTISVSGKVLNEEGLPVISATVSINGTKRGTTTATDGTFRLHEVPKLASLTISSVSFLTQQIMVRGRSNLGEIPLKEFVSGLDETVVKGYYNTTKRLNTGTVYGISGEELAKQPVTNPLLGMIGRVPNLVITPSSGLPNGAVNIQLRGQNSLSQSSLRSEPLIIIDGVPYQNNLSAGNLGFFGIVKDQLSALSFINVNDIEQIDVLSDADATSIYGSRGGNGVILISTKRGKAGATQVSLSLTTGVSKVAKKLDLLNTQQYLQMRREAYLTNDRKVPNKQSTDKNFSNYDLTVWDENRSTDWQKEFLGRPANSYNANISITGGSSSVQYLIGGDYNTQQYVYPGSNKYETGGLNFSISGNSENGKFRSLLNGAYSFNTSNSPANDFTRLAIVTAPNAPKIFTENGSLNWEPDPGDISQTGTWQNPFSQILRTSNSKNNNLRTTGEVSYKLTPTLLFKVSAGYSEIRIRALSLTPLSSYDPSNIGATGASILTNVLNTSITTDPQISYSTIIGSGTLDALLGASYQYQNQENETIEGQGYTSDALLKSLSGAPILYTDNNSSQYKYAALFGRLNYNYRSKYLINVTGRRDGSSRFGPGNQFGNFWSTGVAWIFSNEAFLQKRTPYLSFGKLRFSYGTSGNDGIGDYKYLELYEQIFNTSYQNIIPIKSLGVINPNYHWESIHKLEIAIETGFFSDRLLFNFSYWRSRSSDQLGTYPLPATTGADNIVANQDARIQNQGFDFILNAKTITSKDLTWTTSANIGFQNNKLLSKPAGIYNGYGFNRFITVGQPFSGFATAYISKGVNQANGLYQFVNPDGNVSTDKDNGYFEATKINTRPLTLGISNTLTYKSLSFSFFLQLTKQMGRNYLFDNAFISNNPGSFNSEPTSEHGNLPVEILAHWRSPGDISSIQKLAPDNYSEPIRPLSNKAYNSDLGWVDASFIRLRNVSLSYSLPETLTNKWHLKSFSVYAQGQNLLTLTKYKGLDPEIQSVSSLPLLRAITVGLRTSL